MAEFIPVDSRAISGYRYHEGVLTVRWHSGRTTSYVGVPLYLWQQLQGAVSKGNFISTNIKGKFREQ